MSYTQHDFRLHTGQPIPNPSKNAGKCVEAPWWLFPALIGAVVVGSAIVGLSFGIVAAVAFKVFCWSTGIQ